MPRFDYHIFVCTNSREEGHPRGCCDPEKQAALLRTFKGKVAARELPAVIRVNKSGCLDQCEHGPVVVVYPEGVWYGGVAEVDVDEIVESHLAGGRPVERLRIPEACLNSRACPHKLNSL